MITKERLAELRQIAAIHLSEWMDELLDEIDRLTEGEADTARLDKLNKLCGNQNVMISAVPPFGYQIRWGIDGYSEGATPREAIDDATEATNG